MDQAVDASSEAARSASIAATAASGAAKDVAEASAANLAGMEARILKLESVAKQQVCFTTMWMISSHGGVVCSCHHFA